MLNSDTFLMVIRIRDIGPTHMLLLIGMMMYLASNTIPDIYFSVQHSFFSTHNTEASHETAVKNICWYIQVTKNNGLVFNTSNKLVVDCYVDADFVGLWVHENSQDPICSFDIHNRRELEEVTTHSVLFPTQIGS